MSNMTRYWLYHVCAFILTGVVLAGLHSPAAKAQSTQLAATPPMGWNSWNHFAGKVTDADVRSAADAMVASGMRNAGYVYVNVDDTWETIGRELFSIDTNNPMLQFVSACYTPLRDATPTGSRL